MTGRKEARIVKKRKLLFLSLLVGVTSLLTCAALVARSIQVRPKLGKLVAVRSMITWNSPSVREGIHSMRARVNFPLLNEGRSAVHIISVESACGCTTPTVRPTEIGPGGAGLSAVGTPLTSGERTVVMTIHTDSPLTPEVIVRLKMVSNRLPPFIVGVAGDFAYTDGYGSDVSRDLVVTAIERGPPGKAPRVLSDLPFLSFSGPTVQECPYDESTLLLRTYTFRVAFHNGIPTDSFAGRIWAVDPWTGANAEGVLAFHRATPAIVIAPKSVSLNFDPGEGACSARIAVITKTEMPLLVVEPASDSEALHVSEVVAKSAGRSRTFLIRADPAAAKRIKRFSLIVRASPSDNNPTVVPVTVRVHRDD